ncbi:unnamed protein product [Mytilus coruscus]|uniref:Uncharacterized protein n=1 Tax=Mytilus coruscus TaxID=42192 RepID=A0A6J8EBP3_MYTCO|nr:unnamed protein product [Mytilus coruscus]
MEKDIDQHRRTPLEIVPLPDPIPSRCNSTVEQNPFSLLKDDSTVYIQNIHYVTDGSFLEISCVNPATPPATYKTTNPWTILNDVTTSGQLTSILPSSTSMIGYNTLYIAIGAGGRRKSHHSGKENSENDRANSTADDDDDDGLKYNVLYASSERHDDINVNYSTADVDIPRHIRGEDESGYSTVDDNKKFQNSNLGTYQVTDAALEINEENDVKHINAPTESGCVYAVVDKTNKTNNSVKNVETGATYAVVNKNKMRHSDEGNE